VIAALLFRRFDVWQAAVSAKIEAVGHAETGIAWLTD
jgi:hypothetical protein